MVQYPSHQKPPHEVAVQKHPFSYQPNGMPPPRSAAHWSKVEKIAYKNGPSMEAAGCEAAGCTLCTAVAVALLATAAFAGDTPQAMAPSIEQIATAMRTTRLITSPFH
jgi:hypothetical protein